MREITDHIVEGDLPQNQLKIEVRDEPGAGGASHWYVISWLITRDMRWGININFQNGPIKEAGFNGITNEVLLAIVIDRLRSFQAGPFSCLNNEVALTCCENALTALKNRTKERLSRGVEGQTKA